MILQRINAVYDSLTYFRHQSDMYCITLRSRVDARITGWYDGSDSRWSTDPKRQSLFTMKRDAEPICQELRRLCPRNAEFINIETATPTDPEDV
jgi:hypothetical protein